MLLGLGQFLKCSAANISSHQLSQDLSVNSGYSLDGCSGVSYSWLLHKKSLLPIEKASWTLTGDSKAEDNLQWLFTPTFYLPATSCINNFPQQTGATLGCSLATQQALERRSFLVVCQSGCFMKEMSPALTPCPIALKKKHSHLLQFDHHAQESIQEACKKHPSYF